MTNTNVSNLFLAGAESNKASQSQVAAVDCQDSQAPVIGCNVSSCVALFVAIGSVTVKIDP